MPRCWQDWVAVLFGTVRPPSREGMCIIQLLSFRFPAPKRLATSRTSSHQKNMEKKSTRTEGGSLIRMGRSVWCSFSWGEPMFAQDRAPKVGLHIGTTSSECTVSIRTWGQLWPRWPQLRPNFDPLGSIFGQHTATWP